MKKILLTHCLILISTALFAQQYTQYSTGTAYDAFENPSVRSFIPDSSRAVSFNFLLPTFNINGSLTGNSQATIKNRLFTGSYNDGILQVGQGKVNRFNVNANIYGIMLRIYTNLNGDREMGFSFQTKIESRGLVTDESIQLFSNYTKFTNGSYDNIFNDHIYQQTYHQLGFTYREKINKQVAIGFKISALSGIAYNRIEINQSKIVFGPEGEAALTLAGKYKSSYDVGNFNKQTLWPTFRNPGLAFSFGSSYRSESGVTMQWNLKDAGFIYWLSDPYVGNFNATRALHNLGGPQREDSIARAVDRLTSSGRVKKSFATPINGKAEFSVSKTFPLNYARTFKYIPTFILQKEIFYDGAAAALVNHLQYNSMMITSTVSVDRRTLFSLGGQFMYKTPNTEIFIGSERFFQSVNVGRAVFKNYTALNQAGQYTGADFFVGFNFKLGYFIEHPANASSIPMGDDEKGFLTRIFEKLFKPKVL